MVTPTRSLTATIEWRAVERRRRRRKRRSRVEEHRRRLDEQHRWKRSLLREFIAKHGWSALNKDTVVPPGVKLFSWVRGRRVDYWNGEIRDFLVPELEAIPGWSWDPIRDRHVRTIDNLRAFVRKEGWRALTVETEVDGVRLSQWCATRRQEYKRGTLTDWLIPALEAIPGWSWDPLIDLYGERLEQITRHVARHGWEDFTIHTRDDDGVNIGKWANHIRDLYRKDRLPDWLCVELEAIPGWMWEPREERQQVKVEALRKFITAHGWEAMRREVVVDGIAVGDWFYAIRGRHKDGVLPARLVRELESIPGWTWKSREYMRAMSGKTRARRARGG